MYYRCLMDSIYQINQTKLSSIIFIEWDLINIVKGHNRTTCKTSRMTRVHQSAVKVGTVCSFTAVNVDYQLCVFATFCDLLAFRYWLWSARLPHLGPFTPRYTGYPTRPLTETNGLSHTDTLKWWQRHVISIKKWTFIKTCFNDNKLRIGLFVQLG